MGSPVVHFEIGGADVVRSRGFYSRLFGWDIKIDEQGYGGVDTGSEIGIGGGLMKTPEGVPPYVTLYVDVDDLDKYLELAEELGAKKVVDPMPIGGIGEFAMFADLDGNVIGLFQEAPEPSVAK